MLAAKYVMVMVALKVKDAVYLIYTHHLKNIEHDMNTQPQQLVWHVLYIPGLPSTSGIIPAAHIHIATSLEVTRWCNTMSALSLLLRPI